MKDNSSAKFQRRVIVVPLIRNREGKLLLCKKPPDRGVFPGQWGLPGGGIEPGERMEEALRREIREELGIEVEDIKRLHFKDGIEKKLYPDSQDQRVYMIYLLFACRAVDDAIELNEEFAEYAWVSPPELGVYDLNEETRQTFLELDIL
jgi:nucleoside triphosphatase